MKKGNRVRLPLRGEREAGVGEVLALNTPNSPLSLEGNMGRNNGDGVKAEHEKRDVENLYR